MYKYINGRCIHLLLFPIHFSLFFVRKIKSPSMSCLLKEDNAIVLYIFHMAITMGKIVRINRHIYKCHRWKRKKFVKTAMENFVDFEIIFKYPFLIFFYFFTLSSIDCCYSFVWLWRIWVSMCLEMEVTERKIVDILPISSVWLFPSPHSRSFSFSRSIRFALFNSPKQENLIIFPSHMSCCCKEREIGGENLFLLLERDIDISSIYTLTTPTPCKQWWTIKLHK